MTARTAEHRRLEEALEGKKWRRWGTYLSERQWGTVREDYSADGDAWRYLSHEDAVARAYRWGEDGLLGVCDNRGLVHLALALWNGRDPILKERLFGLTGPEGNHGEDVKEIYYYLDATPTHSYAKAIYKYPQRAFPYEPLRAMAASAGRAGPEPELMDTGAFDEDRYFDVQVEYAKADVEDLLLRYTITNRGPETCTLDVLPTVWFRNTWSWSSTVEPRPSLHRDDAHPACIAIAHDHLGPRWLHADGAPELLFTENETNAVRLFHAPNRTPWVKDAFHRYVVAGERGAVNPAHTGTKACARYHLTLAPGASATIRLRFVAQPVASPFERFDAIVAERIAEADAFYAETMPRALEPEERRVYRQAMAGLLWSKQFYCFDVNRWLRGDPVFPPPKERLTGRNAEWTHLYNSEVLSMPDKWEYPWYAAWDLAFHCIPMALVDPAYAKAQLTLLLREWYMHPNGQIPAYEWAFGDVNPPVHAWAALRVYQIERRMTGQADRAFLETVFHKLLVNFTWWVNRKDTFGRNVFQGGFLGLDNIGVFDRSKAVPAGGVLEQADATSWMAMYCLNLLAIALELARENPSYEDVANKFFEHFLVIAHAMHDEEDGLALWNEGDGFYYDSFRIDGGASIPIKVRSMVGLIPLFAVHTLEESVLVRHRGFVRRAGWFLENRPGYGDNLALHFDGQGRAHRGLLSLVTRARLERILCRLLDEREFLSPYGIRALSRAYVEPYVLDLGGAPNRVAYEPAESTTPMFGGNSNWRGPVWFPVNFLLVETLQKLHHFYGDDLRVECPTGSGRMMNLWQVASEISRRLVSLFLPGPDGRRPAHGYVDKLQTDPHFKDHVLFFEYFHGDNGAGLGAAHQTGWTALVAKLLDQSPLWKSAHGGGPGS